MGINVLLCGNDEVYTGMELAVYSLLTHNKDVNVYIFTMDIDLYNADEGVGKVFKGLNDWQKEKLKKIVRYLDPNSNIIFIDTYPLYMEHLHGGANMYSNFTPYASLRLIADIALPHVENILYLDCDVAVQGDVTEMYHSYLKMGHDYYAYFCPDACDNEGEMVSGVLLMDLRKMRKDGFLKRARENFKKNEYNYPDQCALRDAGKAFPLPETYSYMYELEKCHYKPAILHFTNQLGPKIYHVDYGRNYFYKRYPAFEYVKKGVEWLDSIDL